MLYSCATDYFHDTDDPRPYIRSLADAGFDGIHWCHHWADDYMYTPEDVGALKQYLADLGIALFDIHASAGKRWVWEAAEEQDRQEGVRLIKNRIDMAAALGAAAVVLHASAQGNLDSQRRSLGELEEYVRNRNVKIALENLSSPDNRRLEVLFSQFSPDFLGFCYDTGHGNLTKDRPTLAKVWGNRLYALHVHDNDGKADRHWVPFRGTLDWKPVIEAIGCSVYQGPLTLELKWYTETGEPERDFLATAKLAAERLTAMVEAVRGKSFAKPRG